MNTTYRYRPELAPTVSLRLSASDVRLADPDSDHRSQGAPAFDFNRTSSQNEWMADAASIAAAPQLPGFEDFSLLGRGGMGVVFRARQATLRREVAIKILPGSHAADDRRRLQLRLEAESVARLQHPNIVQVFEVGSHEAVDFVVLEYVAGGTLKQLIAGQPQPEREAAALMETLARAVHQAHLRGVVHRDLKPDNVLLTPEHVPKISDFGLARRVDEQIDPLCADIIGTAAYMSPEQAWGSSRLADVGPAVDIYSLGVMLYELLVGQVPFSGSDFRSTLAQVWSQVPIPVRQRLPDRDADLESICLKCLHKNPQDRYLSAEALADDLRRFLQGEPVAARPIRTPERMKKWARRRPASALLVAVSLLSLLTIAVGTGWYQLRLRRALAEADQNLSAAQSVIDRMLTRVGTQQLSGLPQSETVQREVLEQALAFCERFLKQAPRNPDVRFQAARAQRQVGDLHLLLGDQRAAAEAYQKAVDLSRELAEEYPQQSDYIREWAVAGNNRANLLGRGQKIEPAEDAYRTSLAAWQRLVDQAGDQRDYRRGLSTTATNLGRLLARSGRTAEANQLLQRAVDVLPSPLLPEDRAVRAATGDSAGAIQQARGNYAEAAKDFRQALADLDAAPPDTKRLPESRLAAVASRHNLAAALAAQGKNEDAENEYELALVEAAQLTSDFPELLAARLELSSILTHVGEFQIATDQLAQGRQSLERALNSYRELWPKNESLAGLGLSVVLTDLSRIQLQEQQPAAAAELLAEAHRTVQALAEASPREPDFLSQLAEVLACEAELFLLQERNQEALTRLAEAARLQSKAMELSDGQPAFVQRLRRHFRIWAETAAGLGDLDSVDHVAQQLLSMPGVVADDCLLASGLQLRSSALATTIKGRGTPPAGADSWDAYYVEQALSSLRQAVALGYQDRQQLLTDPRWQLLHDHAEFRRLVESLPAPADQKESVSDN